MICSRSLRTAILSAVITALPLLKAQSYDAPSSVAFISVTTDDIERSLQFYTQVLGGMHAQELSFRYHGDDLYWLLFGREVEEAQKQSHDPVLLGVADISDSGTYEVRGEFVVFDNGLIQMLQFVPRDGAVSGSAHFPAQEPRTSPAYIATPHVCFWVQEDVDFNSFVAQLEAKSAQLGFTKVKANRPVGVSSEAERRAVPKDQLSISVTSGDTAGMSFVAAKGPSGEQFEFLQFTGQSLYNIGRDYCKRRAVSSAFVTNYTDNTWQTQAGLTGRLYGMSHSGTRTDDFWKSVTFYTNELGGDLVQPPYQGTDIRGDAMQNMQFQKETLDAINQNLPPEELGIANISDSGNMRIDYRFSLYDNWMVETLFYTDGLTFGLPGFNPRHNHSSLAYVSSMYIAFFVDPDVDFPAYITAFQTSLATNGFDAAKFNQILGQGHDHGHGQSRNYVTLTSGGLSGLNYAMLSGPAGEHVALVQFKGQSRERLKRALTQYGSVFTGFPETNPWNTGPMDQFCQQFSSSELVGR